MRNEACRRYMSPKVTYRRALSHDYPSAEVQTNAEACPNLLTPPGQGQVPGLHGSWAPLRPLGTTGTIILGPEGRPAPSVTSCDGLPDGFKHIYIRFWGDHLIKLPSGFLGAAPPNG